MAKIQKKYMGGRKSRPGEKQAEATEAREQNVAAKTKFKAGPHAKNDRNAGRANGPLLSDHLVRGER